MHSRFQFGLSHALAFLERTAKQAAGVPGAEAVSATAAAWKKDADLKAAIKLEGRVRATKEKALGAVGKGVDAVRAIYQGLVDDVAGTCLEPRAKALLNGIQVGT